MRNADGDVIALATGLTHSVSRDEFDSKGRYVSLPSQPQPAGSGGKPLPYDQNMADVVAVRIKATRILIEGLTSAIMGISCVEFYETDQNKYRKTTDPLFRTPGTRAIKRILDLRDFPDRFRRR